jgi:hypothetical protein
VSYQLDEHVLSARGLSQAANIEKSVQQFDCGGEIQRIGSVGGFVVANIPSKSFGREVCLPKTLPLPEAVQKRTAHKHHQL